VAWIGGDFMEFRLLVPVLPALFVLIVRACHRLSLRRTRFGLVLLLLVPAGALHHARTFDTTAGIESRAALAAHLDHPDQDWIGVGRRLGQLFGDADVRIAVTAAGAVPYYSRLPALDMLGLSDPWIARHGTPIQTQVGHPRVAPFHYLVERGVHLVLGHPWVFGPRSPPERHPRAAGLHGFAYLMQVDPHDLENASLLGVPLDDERFLIVIYLTPHPAVERAAAADGWQRYALRDALRR
jgi:hypothetical protein